MRGVLRLSSITYGYATGVFLSRKLELATDDRVAFRFIATERHPDHDTIAMFRCGFVQQIGTLFAQVLGVTREMGVLKLGTVALDGTRIQAKASRHSALLYEHAGRIEAHLRAGQSSCRAAKPETQDRCCGAPPKVVG